MSVAHSNYLLQNTPSNDIFAKATISVSRSEALRIEFAKCTSSEELAICTVSTQRVN